MWLLVTGCFTLCDRDMFCAGRVVEDDLKRTMQACGGSIVTTVSGLNDDVLGTCEVFEEKQLGGERSVAKLILLVSVASNSVLFRNCR